MAMPLPSGYSRVSCSAFFRFRVNKGLPQIILHRAYKDQRTIMRPLGGSLRASSLTTITQLQRKFDARFFDGGLDLRFLAPIENIGGIEAWFRTGKGREKNTRPSLVRQLSGDLRVLNRREALLLQPRFSYFSMHAGESSNPNAKIKPTQYLIEVHDVPVPPSIMSKLVAASTGSPGNRRLYFTSAEDVRDQCGPGGYVSSLALTLLRD